ncbi:MAG: hypothetical protein E6Q97_02355 [Desulfurellales bacterium]|nr:MAG: hypothetical protein E6Q97_02355 [Desulfurellales bacterium]
MKRVDEIDLEITTSEQRIAELGGERCLDLPYVKLIAHRDRLVLCNSAASARVGSVNIDRADLQAFADFIARMYGVVVTRPGESIVTAEMYARIAQFAGSDRPESVRAAAVEILGILDGEKA